MKTNLLLILLFLFQTTLVGQEENRIPIRPGNEPVAEGKFKPTWESLSQYQVPEWFRNAKINGLDIQAANDFEVKKGR